MPIEPSKPAPVLVTRRFDDFEAFSDAYAGRLALSGLFVAAIDPLPVGTTVHIDFKLTDGFRLFHGVGEVVWVRPDTLGPDWPSGMGVRFLALDEKGRELILKLLEDHVRGGGLPFELEPPPDGVVTTPTPAATPKPEASRDPAREEDADPMAFAPPWQQELPDIPSDFLSVDESDDADAGADAGGDRTVLVSGGAALGAADALASPPPPAPGTGAAESGDLEPIAADWAYDDELESDGAGPGGGGEERGSDGLAAAVARLEPLPGGARADDSQPVSLEVESVDAALDFGLDPAEGWVQDDDARAADVGARDDALEEDAPEADSGPPAGGVGPASFDDTSPVLSFDDPSGSAMPVDAGVTAPLDAVPPPPAAPAVPLETVPPPPAPAAPSLSESQARAHSWLAEAEASDEDEPAAAAAGEPAAVAEEPPSRRMLPLLIALLALVALAAAGWLSRDRWLPLLGVGDDGTAPPIAADTGTTADRGLPMDASGTSPDSPAAGGAPATDFETDRPESPEAPLADRDIFDGEADPGGADPGGVDPGEAGDFDPARTLDDAPERDPAPAAALGEPPDVERPPALPPDAAPGSRLETISWRETPEGTVVVLAPDGPIAEERLSWTQLGGPNPRLLLILRGMSEPYRVGRLPVDSATVRQIRTGFHPKPGGDELHVVVDLAAGGVALSGIPDQRADGRIELLIARP